MSGDEQLPLAPDDWWTAGDGWVERESTPDGGTTYLTPTDDRVPLRDIDLRPAVPPHDPGE